MPWKTTTPIKELTRFIALAQAELVRDRPFNDTPALAERMREARAAAGF